MRNAAVFAVSALVITGSIITFAIFGGEPGAPAASPARELDRSRDLDVNRESDRDAPSPGHAAAASAMRAVYRLEYQRRMASGGRAISPQTFSGTWSTEQLSRADRVEIRFDPTSVSNPDGSLDKAALAKPFQIGLENGRLTSIGFDPSVGESAREALATLAAAVQLTERDDPRYVVTEEDLDGRFESSYERTRSTELRRTRRFTAMRTFTGLNEKLAASVGVDGEARFDFDADGLLGLTISERGHVDLSFEGGVLTSELEVRLVRESTTEIAPPRAGANLELRPIGSARRKVDPLERERQILAGRNLPELLAAFSELSTLPKRGAQAAHWRKNQLLALRALLRLQPATARDIARAIAEDPHADPRQIGSLAQALGLAGTPEARDALVDLMKSDLPAVPRQRVAVALGVLAEPTAETIAVLKTALDDSALGSAPALAMGAEAQKLGDQNDSVRDDAVDTLLDRYHEAVDYRERRVYLQALANSGDPRALQVMTAALTGSDTRLAEVAAFGLRFIPGADADDALEGVLASAAPARVRVEAVRAAGFREAAYWHPQLQALLANERDADVRRAIERVLAGGA